MYDPSECKVEDKVQVQGHSCFLAVHAQEAQTIWDKAAWALL
jgi:hypothetical protein